MENSILEAQVAKDCETLASKGAVHRLLGLEQQPGWRAAMRRAAASKGLRIRTSAHDDLVFAYQPDYDWQPTQEDYDRMREKLSATYRRARS